MLTAIESLDELSRSLWTACTSRDFDIGYECGGELQGFYHVLSTVTLARVATAGATVVIRLYPAEPPFKQRPEEKQRLAIVKQFYPGQLIGLVLGFITGFLQQGINTALPLSAFSYFIAKALLVNSNEDRPRQLLYGVIAYILVFVGVGLSYQNWFVFLIYIPIAVSALKKLSN